MDKRHDDILTTRLETAVLDGMVFISLAELRHWYGMQRLGARCWRDLAARWDEVKRENSGELMKISRKGGIYLFGNGTVRSVIQEDDE